MANRAFWIGTGLVLFLLTIYTYMAYDAGSVSAKDGDIIIVSVVSTRVNGQDVKIDEPEKNTLHCLSSYRCPEFEPAQHYEFEKWCSNYHSSTLVYRTRDTNGEVKDYAYSWGRGHVEDCPFN